jgi:hypothetical protein
MNENVKGMVKTINLLNISLMQVGELLLGYLNTRLIGTISRL